MTGSNPWLERPATADALSDSIATRPATSARRRAPRSPQPGVSAPQASERLPQHARAETAVLWWVGTHGGAGETTLAALADGTRAAEHAWPIPEESRAPANRIVLVARTNYAGLISAQRAATEWASGAVEGSVELAGLVLIADAPGRLPKPLRDLAQIVSGGVPQVWQLPWNENWRLGPSTAEHSLPREYLTLFTDLDLTLSTHNDRKDQA